MENFTNQAIGEFASRYSWLGWLLAGLIIMALGWLLVGRWLPALGKNIWAKAKPIIRQPEPMAKERQEINDSLGRLNGVLADLERDTNKATILLADAEIITTTLVGLVAATAIKADKMDKEIQAMQTLLAAITTSDRLKIIEAATACPDPHVRTLATAKVTDEAYWSDVAAMVAGQSGTLKLWRDTYRQYAGNLLADITTAKAMFAANTAALEIGSASRPLATINAQLGEAQRLLEVQRRPEGARLLRQLPASNAGLLH